MFNCDTCGKVTKPREPQHLTVVEKRARTYTNVVQQMDDDSDRVRSSSRESRGWEIVKEVRICTACIPVVPAIHG